MADEKEKALKDDDLMTRAEIWMRNNKKSLIIIGGSIVAIVGGFFAYKYFFIDKPNKEADMAMYVSKPNAQSPFFYYERDSFRLAAEGNPAVGTKGIQYILDKYKSADVAPVAAYMWGMSHLHLGVDNSQNYETAITWLDEVQEEFDEDEILLTTQAIGAQGDAYLELGDLENAVAKYEAAASRKQNVLLTPYYMMKAAMVHEELGNWDKALDFYKTIKADYRDSDQAQNIEKHIGRAEHNI